MSLEESPRKGSRSHAQLQFTQPLMGQTRFVAAKRDSRAMSGKGER